MKIKKIITLIIAFILSMSLVACFEPKCSYEDCDETDIYKDGYCEKHYYIVEAEKTYEEIKDFLS